MKALFASVKTKSRRAFMGLLKMSAPFLFPSWPGASEESQILSPFRLVFLDGMQGDLHRRFQHDHVGILRTKKLCDTRPCNAPKTFMRAQASLQSPAGRPRGRQVAPRDREGRTRP